MKIIPIVLIAASAAVLLLSCAPGAEGVIDTENIDIKNDPQQISLDNAAPIVLSADGFEIVLSPQAEYLLNGIVLGRENYYQGWNSNISPCDLAVAWGKMTMTGLYKKVDWSQSGRWYFWRYDEEFPFDNTFIARYSANTHVIPVNKNIRNALLRIKSGDTISIHGFLVNVDASKNGANFWWNSSLQRDDTGDGSCEVMFVDQVRFRGMAYR